MRVLSGLIYLVYGGDHDYWTKSVRPKQLMVALLALLTVVSVLWIAEYEQVSPTVVKGVNWLWHYWANELPFSRLDGLMTTVLAYLGLSILAIHLFGRKWLFTIVNVLKNLAYSGSIIIIGILGLQLIQGRNYIQLFLALLFLLPFTFLLTIGHKPIYMFLEHMTLLWFLLGHYSLPGFSLVSQLISWVSNALAFVFPSNWAWLITVYLPLGLPNLLNWNVGRLAVGKAKVNKTILR